MPGGYCIDSENRVVISRGWGDLTTFQALLHVRNLAADARFQPGFRQVMDLRRVTSWEIPHTMLKRLAGLSPFGPGARRAMIANCPSVCELAQTFADLRVGYGDCFLISHDIDEAIDWLELDGARSDVLAQLADMSDMVPQWVLAAGADRN